MIKTSYYANYRNFPKDLKPVSISLLPPTGFKGEVDLSLTPTKEILNTYKYHGEDEVLYRKRYRLDVLGKLHPAAVYKKHRHSLLLCFEKTGDFCHRNLVSEWLVENGFPAGELGEEKKTVRIAVVGSRDFGLPGDSKETAEKRTAAMFDLAEEYLYSLVRRRYANDKVVIVSGGAKGADAFAERFAKKYGYDLDVYLADWEKDGKSAGFKRNFKIWDNADLGFAIWNGESKGTEHSFDISWRQNKPLYILSQKHGGFIPRVVKGDIIKHQEKYDVLLFPANSTLKNNRELVMGRGCALAFKNAFAGIEFELGAFMSSMSYGLATVIHQDKIIGAFQTKGDWRQEASMDLVKNSVKELKKFINENPGLKIGMCFPGIGLGGLDKDEVLREFKGLNVDLFVK